MLNNFMLIVVASVLCGVMGRMGGSGRYPRQVRVIGVPCLLTLLLFLLGVHSWWLFATCGLLIAAISTYWDFLVGEDNFFLHGFFLGLSTFPVVLFFTHNWIGFIFCILATTLFVGLWSKFISLDVLEEVGRYACLPLFIWLII